MPVIKCKMCGGDLNIVDDSSVCECEYCGTKQTVPKVDDEKKLKLFSRAGKLLRSCEFDKASGVFESIIAEFPEEAEAYWGLILCKYGIEYVDDPATGKKVPTCHRSSFESVEDDSNFEQACENADASARRVYREEARQIETLRKRILEVSGKEEPYDVFISYKELDEDGDRTPDSVIAQDIYRALTKEGYRVFFSRISLEGKLGVEYEPYIFAALNSAKVMIVVGTDYEYFDAVWVKNEWSRFLKLIASGQQKTVIPVYKDMDPYDMPKELRALAAQNMGKIGAMQDLIHGVEKLLGKPKDQELSKQLGTVQHGGSNVSALLDRGFLSLEDGDWDKATDLFDQVLNNDPRNAYAYLGLAMAEEKCLDRESFRKAYIDPASRCKSNKRLARARQFGDGELQKWFDQLGVEAREAGEKARAKAEADRIAKEKAEREAAEKARIEAEKIRIEKAKAEQEAAAAREIARKSIISELKTAREKRKNVRSMIAAGSYHTVGLKADGTVVTAGAIDPERASWDPNSKTNYGQCDTKEWKDIVSVAAGSYHTVGLKENGSVIAVGSNYKRQCDTSSWTDVIEIAAGNTFTLGRKANGTVLATGQDSHGQINVDRWTDIIAIAAGGDHAVGLKSDGSIIDNYHGECSTPNWENIVAVSADSGLMVGLKDDGTVKATGRFKKSLISEWNGIVAIEAKSDKIVGLRSDGSLVSLGSFHIYSQNSISGGNLKEVSQWSDIVSISMGFSHLVGLKADGSVIAIGENNRGQCRTYGWKLFNNYESIDEERRTAKDAEAERIKKAEAARIAAIEREEAQRREKIEEYMESKKRLEEELSTLHGLFTLKRRKEIESTLMWYDMEINNLK